MSMARVQVDQSHLDEIRLRRSLSRLVLVIGRREYSMTPEQESQFWEQVQDLVYKERDQRVRLH